MSGRETDTIKIKVNGKTVEAAPGKTILEVVREQGLDNIPTLCYSRELEPYGSCFLCVVEVKGRWNLVPACATRIAPNMEIETRNERVMAARKTALELLLSNHFADCVAPCQGGCPAGVDVQGYIALSAMGQYNKAVDLIRRTNPLPAICGRVCVRKCEMVCRREEVDSAVGINAIKDGVSLFTRDSSYGGSQITEGIMSSLKVDFEEAEKVKLGGANVEKEKGKLEEIFTSVVSEWVQEIKRALDFVASTYPDETIEKILVSGGSCKIPGFQKYLQSQTGIPVTELNPFSNLIIDEKRFDPQYLKAMAPQAAVAVGLALRSIGDK